MLSKRITGRLFSKKVLVKESLKSSQVMVGSMDRYPISSGGLRRETIGMLSGGNDQHASNSSGKNLVQQKVTSSFSEE